jgi:hypothetical protein
MNHEDVPCGQTISQYFYLKVLSCIINGCKSGNQAYGKFTTTMYLPTKPSFYGNFKLNTVFHKWDSLPTQHIQLPVMTSCSLQLQILEKQKIQ